MRNPILSALLLAGSSMAVAAAPVPPPGTSFRDAAFAPVMMVIPAGRALLGSSVAETEREGRTGAAAAAERPQREVAFDTPFAIGRSHVTRGEFGAFARATGRPLSGCVVAIGGAWSNGPQPAYGYANVGWPQREDEPALCVNWADAIAYAEWLSARTGHAYRLPTEAEWEYAARGGTVTSRWWGDGRERLCAHANGGDADYARLMPADRTANLDCADGFPFTSPAGRFPANPFGLHDMIGNAWQWVADCYVASPGSSPLAAPCPARTIRGGSWHNGPAVLRSATRFSLPPDMRSSSLGFRIVRELR